MVMDIEELESKVLKLRSGFKQQNIFINWY